MLELLAELEATSAPADWLAWLRVMLCYTVCQHRLPDFARPRRFTEWVQWRKLHDRTPEQAVLMDKLAAKAMAARRLGPEWCIPTLWTGTCLPDARPFGCPAIVKARHGCNQYRALRSPPGAAEWRALQRRTRRWMRAPYGGWLDEWGYEGTTRGLIAEPLVGADSGKLPIDYKIYVFGGRATHVQVHLDRAGRHRWVLHDRDYRALVPGEDAPPRPASLSTMLAAAEELAVGWDFLRVDFYEVCGQALFGESCLYPGSGLDPFAADWIDVELGALWRAARQPQADQPPPVSWTNTSSRSASRVVTSSIA